MTATTSVTTTGPGEPLAPARTGWRSWRWWARLRVLLPVLLVVVLCAAVWRFAVPHGPAAYAVPQNPGIEATYGIRFSQVDIVGDGGLVELGYTVLDPEKASQFQSDTKNPPKLHSEARDGTVAISALMKQGHNLRPGQTYFVLYENPHNTIRPGETVTIEYKGQRLEHAPAR